MDSWPRAELRDTPLASMVNGWAWDIVTYSGVHLANGVLEHLHVLHVKAFLEFLWKQRG